MSISTLGASGAVLAVMLALALPATASAGTYQSGCVLNDTVACQAAQIRTYDDHRADAPGNQYVASWLLNPATGARVSDAWGTGVAGGAILGGNASLPLAGFWGNFSGTNGVWVFGTFNY